MYPTKMNKKKKKLPFWLCIFFYIFIFIQTAAPDCKLKEKMKPIIHTRSLHIFFSFLS